MRCARWLAVFVLGALPALAQAPADTPKPLLSTKLGEWSLQLPLSLAARGEWVAPYALDSAGTRMPAGWAVSPRARVGLLIESGRTWSGLHLLGEYEQDVPTGTHDYRAEPIAVGLPDSEGFSFPVRKAYLRAVLAQRVVVGAGLMTSHWGLGLVANDGAHGWEPGSATFTDPRGGDRMLRAFISTAPLTPWGLIATLGADKVMHDDALLTSRDRPPGSGLGDDTAYQGFLALTAGYEQPTSGGAYVVQRWQTSSDGRYLHATVIDLTGTSRLKLGETASLLLAGEGALITGATTFAPTVDHPAQDVRQLGGVARIGLDMGKFGGVLDVLYASGDQNLSDGSQNGFSVNSNFQEGLFLFRQVIAAQTARSPITAANPELVGQAPPGLDRFPTRGSITNTVTFFPRLWWRPLQVLEVYGGPLFALAAGSYVDPMNTTLAGGDPRNPLNGSPGNYLGTELDVGIRYRGLLAGTTLGVGVEGGVLLPGSALRNANGQSMGNVSGAR
jgi:hypothetical protein